MEAVLTLVFWALSFSLFKDAHIALGLSEKDYPKTPSSWDVCLPSKKVLGGEHIDITEAPFILKMEGKYWPYPLKCGATVLSEEVAITAAHCLVRDFPRIAIRLRSGITDLIEYGDVHDVKKVVLHEYYNDSVDNNYDIALLFVQSPFKFSDHVQPIKLPTKELDKETLVMVAGYGVSEGQRPSLSKYPDLRRVIVPIVDRKICYEVLKKKYKEIYNKTIENIINEKVICAGYPNGKYDACRSDTGGPLYLNKTLYGIISWGLGCAQQCIPRVYTDVYKFLDWIKSTIEKNKGRHN